MCYILKNPNFHFMPRSVRGADRRWKTGLQDLWQGWFTGAYMERGRKLRGANLIFTSDFLNICSGEVCWEACRCRPNCSFWRGFQKRRLKRWWNTVVWGVAGMDDGGWGFLWGRGLWWRKWWGKLRNEIIYTLFCQSFFWQRYNHL